MTIWVAQEPRGTGIDLQVLYEYAKKEPVRFVFTKAFNISQHPQESMATAENFAAQFDFKNDRIVLAGGDPLAGIFLAIALTQEAEAAGAHSFRSLRYVRARDEHGERTVPQYIPITIPIGTPR